MQKRISGFFSSLGSLLEGDKVICNYSYRNYRDSRYISYPSSWRCRCTSRPKPAQHQSHPEGSNLQSPYSPLSAERRLRLCFLAATDAQPCENTGKNQHKTQTAYKTSSQAAGSDHRADLVDQECQGVTHTQLQTDTSPEPSLLADLCVHCAQSRKTGRGKQVKH